MNSLSVCHVCSSNGAGRHFGGVCCERCMKFMRRTVRLNIRFECAGSGDCEVTPNGRTTCKACRFAACLRAGMDPRLVHSDRLLDGDYSRGKKAKAAASPPPDPSASSGAIWEIIGRTDGPLGFRRPPLANCPDFETLLRFFHDVDRFVDAFEDPSSSSSCPRWSLNVGLGEVFLHAPSKLASRTKVVWSAAKKLSTDMILPVWSRNIVHYVDTASHIPELRLLEPRDQLRLLAGRSMPSMWLLLLQRSLRYTTKRGILSTSGVYFPVDASDEEEGFDTYALETRRTLYDWLIEPLKELNLSDEEFFFLRLFVFFGGAPKMSEKGREVVRNARLHYESLFIRFLCSRHDHRTAVDRMGRVLSLLPIIEQAVAYYDNRMVSAVTFNVDKIRGTFTHDLYLWKK